MKNKRFSYVAIAVISICLALVLVHYVRQTVTSPPFSRRIAKADRVVVTGGFLALDDGRIGPRLIATLTGHEVTELKRTLASARVHHGHVGIKLFTEVSFYRGTNCLGKIHTDVDWFHVDGDQLVYYQANKDKLESLVHRPLQEFAKAQINRPNPMGPASGTQPFGSETTQEPAAASSHRSP